MGRVIRAVVAIGVLLLLAAAAPAMRASWQTLMHFQGIRNSHEMSIGTLTVTSCKHEWLPHDWSCRGNYVVTDPLGDAGHDRLDIPLVNDFRKHAVGDRIGVKLITAREDAAYLVETEELVKTGVFWLGVLIALVALVLTFVRLWGLGIAALIGLVVAGLLMSPVLVSLW